MKIDKFHHHELLDRLSMVLNVIGTSIETHPALPHHKKANRHLKKAIEHLYAAYNEVGHDTLGSKKRD